MSDNTCGTCRWWVRDEFGCSNENMSGEKFTQIGISAFAWGDKKPKVFFGQLFGCIHHEPRKEDEDE